jgi:ribonucleoside-diphosphate reductase beta chain
MIFDDKNSTHDPNKILPFRYPWARKFYLNGVNNNWTPEEIPMQQDIEQWKSKKVLTEDERRMILWNLGFFSTAESLTANNIVLAVYKHLRVPEFRQYLLRQAYEEAVHTDMFIYACDSFGFTPDEVYDAYLTIPSIKEKDEFVAGLTKGIDNPAFEVDPSKPETIQMFVRDLIGFYLIMEGLFFYAGFAMMLGLKENRKMVGVGQQFEYTLRDEGVHVDFGLTVIKNIIKEYPEIWTEDFKKEIQDLVREAVRLETVYVYDAIPNGIFGMKPESFVEYVKHIADRRLKSIGLPMMFKAKNPLAFMSKSTDIPKEKNFFETRVTDYKLGSALKWD